MKAVYSTKRKFRCVMFTIVFRTAALKAKFPGGIRKFGKKHSIRYNRDIAVYCDMGSGIDDIVKTMNKIGMVYPKEYFIFDASGHWGMPEVKDRQPVQFQMGWLRGYKWEAGTMVYFSESTAECLIDPGHPRNGQILWARML